jgi:type I restriction enzyme, S subunit
MDLVMNSEFRVFKLGDVADIIAGGDKPKIFSTNKSDLNNIPVFANAEKKYGLQGYTDKPRIVEPAVTMAARGSNVGFVVVRKKPFYPIVRLLALIPDRERLDADYLFYNLKQNRQNGTGSGQPQITIPDITSRSISLPSLDAQQKVAKVLSSLDAKIELNNKINTELEAMAKLIYDYWFVQFDFPDANGKPYKSSGGKMVYNEALKREIPDGWSDSMLEDVISRSGTGLNPRKNFKLGEGENYYITIKSIKNGKIIFDEKCDRVSDKSLNIIDNRSDLQVGDVLFTSIQPVGVTYLIQEKPTNWNINESVFTIRADVKKVTPEFLFMLLSSKEIKLFTKQSSSGSIHKGIRHGVLKTFKLPYGGKTITESFSEVISPILKKIYLLDKENQKLAELRDWLLPMLMNGQVTVNYS